MPGHKNIRSVLSGVGYRNTSSYHQKVVYIYIYFYMLKHEPLQVYLIICAR